MTLSPSEDRRIEGVEGPKYELNKGCPVAGCGDTRGLERHHMWRKSDVIGDFWWVKTSDGETHGNCIKLCGFHHREVTDNIARIVLGDDGVFTWKDLTIGNLELQWQPPSWEGETFLQVANEPRKREVQGIGHVLTEGHDPEVCPTCLRKMPRIKEESEEEKAKVRKTWSVAVPLDRWEDGAEVIDALLQAAHEELNRGGYAYGEGKKVKYYILTTALAMFIQHGPSLLADA